MKEQVSGLPEQQQNDTLPIIKLTKAERVQLFGALLNPAGPNEALRQAAARYRSSKKKSSA